MVRAAKGHKGPEWEEIAAVGAAVQVLLQASKQSYSYSIYVLCLPGIFTMQKVQKIYK